ncbi:MAG TPA: DUF3179 domain-containing (seleno)protein [Tepidisphaeraceae bacterium]|jgi:hypothetical protein
MRKDGLAIWGPVGLIALAVFFGAVMAYGTHPGWIREPYGLTVIMISRRMQWGMVAMSLLACVSLIALVIAGRRRAWWLIGLAPVLALFGHRFTSNEVGRFTVVDEPKLVAVEDVRNVGENDLVVGLTLGDNYYAYPYAQLYWTPVIVQTDRDQRVLLAWNAYANACLATMVTRDVRARELDVVCEPANALLIYNSRVGQFINGVTGRMPGGAKPQNFLNRVPVWKGPWKAWRDAHPATKVYAGVGKIGGPTAAILPREPLAKTGDVKPQTPVVLIAARNPAAILPAEISTTPSNVRVQDLPLLVFRDPSGFVRAYDRHVEPDLVSQFTMNKDPKRKATFIDIDTNTGWTINGVAIDGEKPRLGQKLSPLDVQEELYWGVAKFWWPDAELIKGEGEPVQTPEMKKNAATSEAKRTTSRRRRR